LNCADQRRDFWTDRAVASHPWPTSKQWRRGDAQLFIAVAYREHPYRRYGIKGDGVSLCIRGYSFFLDQDRAMLRRMQLAWIVRIALNQARTNNTDYTEKQREAPSLYFLSV
jgi:hypothetical protein